MLPGTDSRRGSSGEKGLRSLCRPPTSPFPPSLSFPPPQTPLASLGVDHCWTASCWLLACWLTDLLACWLTCLLSCLLACWLAGMLWLSWLLAPDWCFTEVRACLYTPSVVQFSPKKSVENCEDIPNLCDYPSQNIWKIVHFSDMPLLCIFSLL